MKENCQSNVSALLLILGFQQYLTFFINRKHRCGIPVDQYGSNSYASFSDSEEKRRTASTFCEVIRTAAVIFKKRSPCDLCSSSSNEESNHQFDYSIIEMNIQLF